MKTTQKYLDERLQQVAAFVPCGASVADIGTDHGYLAIALYREHRARRVIAGDKNHEPCEAARRMIARYNLIQDIEVREGDGLSILAPQEVDTLCIAGMGGSLIASILETGASVVEGVKTMVLQPMTDAFRLRTYLYLIGFSIEEEALVRADGRLYVIEKAVRCETPIIPSEVELLLGPRLLCIRGPLFEDYRRSVLTSLYKIKEGMEESIRARTSEKYKCVLRRIEEVERT